jgi:8-oxo-dGTP pyrophosphatase MutT (NUDIX family)
MDKFSSLKPKEEFKKDKEEPVYQDKHMSVIKFEDWSVVRHKDYVVCIPYLIESNQVILRYEYIPTFKYTDGQEYHLTLVGGGVEEGEPHNLAITRELEEEAGIVLREDYELEPLRPLFLTKMNANKVYPYIIALHEKDYHEIVPKGDGTKHEAISKSVKVNISQLKNLETSDLITDYILLKLKEYMNLQK